MSLSDEAKKRIQDHATGASITYLISIDDQIAAIREQVADMATVLGVTQNEKFQALQNIVTKTKRKQ